MGNKTWKVLGMLGLAVCLSWFAPADAQAAEIQVETSTTLYAKIDSTVSVRAAAEEDSSVLGQVLRGETYEIMESEQNGWLKIATSEGNGYIKSNRATVIEKTQEKVDESAKLRQEVADYALQFVGNRYVYGGTDPNKGVDCSGFTRYVLQHAAGVSVSHSSRAQAGEGRKISLSEARPGDLIFYGKGKSINHVAMYIGDGQVVHASSAKTGIKVSNATYRTPVCVVSFLD